MKMMIKKRLAILLILFVNPQLFAQTEVPVYRNPARPVEQRTEHLLSLLTVEEKATFLSGKDLWHLEGIERLGIPAVQVTDCGHGITVIFDKDGNYSGCSTCFPTAVGQAASWNRQLEYDIGIALAREARALGSAILLAPMVNIHRTPLNGRNYETYSEDPYLTGTMAASFIRGVQSQHVGACIKAFTANNQQANQHKISVRVTERALREIYFPGFRIAIEEAQPWALMTCYNKVNGEYTSESTFLLTDIIKNEWNYTGFIVSDWRATHSKRSISAGLDLEMPGPGKYMHQQDILQALDSGTLTSGELDDRVGRILKAIIKTKLLDAGQADMPLEWNSPAHQKLALKAAEESIVLLKNQNNVLPFDKRRIKKLAVIGPNARDARLGGGGSASVTACYAVSPLQGLQNLCSNDMDIVFKEGCSMSGNLPIVYSEYLATNKNGKTVNGLKAEYFNGGSCKGTPVLVRTDEKIDFSWGWATPGPGINKLSYSARWTGQLHPPVTGTYTLGLTCTEAGCRLFLNDSLIIDAWGESEKDNFEARFSTISKNIEVYLKSNVDYDIRIEFYKKGNKNSIRFEWDIPGQDDPIAAAVKLATESDAAVIFAGLSNLFEGGNNDRESLNLPGDQNELIRRVAQVNPKTTVVLINGSPVAMPWLDEVGAVLEAYYPGQEGGNAITNVLFGRVNPSGKLPETFPKRLEDNPTSGHYPGSHDVVNYAEGIFVGYRHYDHVKIEPLFPFGHGLSYTDFEYSNLRVDVKKDSIIVRCDVKNTGAAAGAEVVQLYIRDVECTVERPEKELKGFDKVWLQPGEIKPVELCIDKSDLAFFSEKKKKWIVELGEFVIQLASSSRDIRLQQRISID